MRAISSIRASASKHGNAGCERDPTLEILLTCHCQLARAATCGRCVTQRTCRSASQLTQQTTDNLGHAATDTDIDFVKDKRWYAVPLDW
jgi:hypothetical protein